jgi:HlyD family secretion protein
MTLRKSHAIISGILLLLLVFYGYQWYVGPVVEVEHVTQGRFVKTVVASGHVENSQRISISSQMTGTVFRIPVAEGQTVKKGQLLIELENSEQKAFLRQALATEQQAITNLRLLHDLKAPLANQATVQANATYIVAQKNLARSIDLFEKGFIGAAVKEEAQRATQISESQLAVAREQLKSLQANGSEVAVAQTFIRQARAGVETAQARLNYTQIYASKNGILIARNIEVGDGVLPGKVLMILSPEGPIQLVLQIDEKNLSLLLLNQIAWVSADAFPEKKFKARLEFMNPSIDPQRGSVEIKLTAIDPPAEIKQDMTVSVDIEVASRDSAVLAPLTSIHDLHGANPWVLVLKSGITNKQSIQLGLIGQGWAEILTGLKAGDLLVPLRSGEIVSGLRIRVNGNTSSGSSNSLAVH